MYRSKKFDDPNQGNNNIQGLLFQGMDNNHGYNLSQLPMLQRFNHITSSSSTRYGDCSWRGHPIYNGTNYMGGGRGGGSSCNNNSSSMMINRATSLYASYNHNNKPLITNSSFNIPSSLIKGISPSSSTSPSTKPNHSTTTAAFEAAATKFLFHRWSPHFTTTTALESSMHENNNIHNGLKRKLMQPHHNLDLELSLKVPKTDSEEATTTTTTTTTMTTRDQVGKREGNNINAANTTTTSTTIDLDHEADEHESSLSLSLSSSSSSKLSTGFKEIMETDYKLLVRKRDRKFSIMNLVDGVNSKRGRMASTLDLTL
ncbi:hypothetical protein LINPERHAP2_LOCUS30359 [Linum perenne]